MPDQTQQPPNQLPPTIDFVLPPEPAAEVIDEEGDALAREEIKRLSLSNEKLRKLAAKYPPPPEYFEGEEEMPFDPIEE